MMLIAGWQPLECPTDTDYPADAICGFDFSKLACFSPGESGSPLMLTDLTQPGKERMHVQASCSRSAKTTGISTFSFWSAIISCHVVWF